MFRVMAVDDEPLALEFLCQIVERRCPGFEVAGRAANGRECLDRLDEIRPDVVLTDIKMPVMDGIALAKAVHEARPDIRVVIVSGYQEFEYARSAMKYGVYDYLLKPLTPSAFAEVFARLRELLEQRLSDRRNRVLKQLSNREEPDPRELALCFPEAHYHCILVRRNGLPKRFAHSVTPETYAAAEDSVSIFGRDEMERIYLRSGETDPAAFSRDIVGELEAAGNYLTAVYTAVPFPIERLPDALRLLYRALDEVTILGVTQILPVDRIPNRGGDTDEAHSEDYRTLEHYLKTGDPEQACREFERLMQLWEDARIPQLQLERRLRYILFLAARMEAGRHLMGVGEHLLDDAFYSIASMAELREYMKELLFPEAFPAQPGAQRMDSPEQFERIRGYVLANCAEPMSLELLSRHFSISQSYISKMFRKYTGKSFNAFLTETRMASACAILRAKPDTLVREVATMVGYADPFYFSKCFRAYTGLSPTDYVQSGANDPARERQS